VTPEEEKAYAEAVARAKQANAEREQQAKQGKKEKK
jgi:hypothetical protein